MLHTIPPATVLLAVALIGVVGFLAAEQLWLGLRRRQSLYGGGQSLYLGSAAISLDALAYLLARVVQSVSDEPTTARMALQVMHTAGLLLVPIGLATIRAGLGRPTRQVVATALAATAVMLAILWLTPAFLGASAQPRTNVLGQRYWAATPTAWAGLLAAYYFAAFSYVSWMLWRGRFRPTERRVAAVLIALVLIAGANDLSISLGAPTFHTLEFALAAVAICLDYILVRRLSHELERALASVSRSETKFRTLIERAPDAILLRRGERFTYANPAALRYLGYEEVAELVAQPIDRILVNEPIPASSRSAAAGALELTFRTHDGRELTGEVVQLEVTFDDHAAIMLRVRDLTELRRMEAHLALSARLASVGTLAAGVAHEINNPLSYVLTNLELASKRLSSQDGNGPARLDQLLRDARQGAERVAKIVRDLKTLSRPDAGTPHSVNLAEVLQSCVSVAWNEIRHRAQLRSQLDDSCFVRANEGRLAQVFLNLLVNAAQSIEEGHAAENEVRIRSHHVEGGAWIAVEVSDTGCGIPPKTLERIFEPFVTERETGTGLGLSICHGIVAGLGGSIEVDSEVGRGTTFRVLLPASEPFEVAAIKSAAAPGPSSRLRVLVVDDEIMIRRSLERGLSAHDVTSAAGGREAIELCLRQQFDVVLCDLMMPDVSGVDVFEAVSSQRSEYRSRFVFMTGGAFSPKVQDFLASIDNVTLEKPLSLEDLEGVLRETSSVA